MELQQPVLDEWAAAIGQPRLNAAHRYPTSEPLQHARAGHSRRMPVLPIPLTGKNGNGDDAHKQRLAASKLSV
jgi:hypothetical protein